MIIPFAIMKDNANSYFNKLLLIGTIIALSKSNQFIKEFMGGIGINADFKSGLSCIKSTLSN